MDALDLKIAVIGETISPGFGHSSRKRDGTGRPFHHSQDIRDG
jgi:hypothetical protein